MSFRWHSAFVVALVALVGCTTTRPAERQRPKADPALQGLLVLPAHYRSGAAPSNVIVMRGADDEAPAIDWPDEDDSYSDVRIRNLLAQAERESEANGARRRESDASDSWTASASDSRVRRSPSTRSRRPSAPSSDYSTPPSGYGGTVHVRGYYRRDGTYVRSHTRRAPRR
jgi:hypothetical protein